MITLFDTIATYFTIASLVCTCFLFCLFLLFKPLRTHPGGLLMLCSFFQIFWLSKLILDSYELRPPLYNFLTLINGNWYPKHYIICIVLLLGLILKCTKKFNLE